MTKNPVAIARICRAIAKKRRCAIHKYQAQYLRWYPFPEFNGVYIGDGMTTSRFPRYGADSTTDAVFFRTFAIVRARSCVARCHVWRFNSHVSALSFLRYCRRPRAVSPPSRPRDAIDHVLRSARNDEIELLIDICIRAAEYRS